MCARAVWPVLVPENDPDIGPCYSRCSQTKYRGGLQTGLRSCTSSVPRPPGGGRTSNGPKALSEKEAPARLSLAKRAHYRAKADFWMRLDVLAATCLISHSSRTCSADALASQVSDAWTKVACFPYINKAIADDSGLSLVHNPFFELQTKKHTNKQTKQTNKKKLGCVFFCPQKN